MWTAFSHKLEEAYLALVYWLLLLSLDRFDDSSSARREFWEQLNHGWMREYIWPYDDWYNPTPSHERKLRLGR